MKNASLLIHPEELSRAWIDRIAEHCIPTLALHPVGGHRAHLSFADLLSKLEEPSYRALLDYAHERGLQIEYEIHAARYLLPAEEFDAHPEWFRMNCEGIRTPDVNFCASNTEALDFVAERAAETVKKLYRSTDRYFLWLDDTRDFQCHCPACAKLSPSDYQLKILNHIITRLRRDNPRASIPYLAYQSCIDVPKEITPEDGIFLEYAPINRDFHKPMTESAESEPLQRLISYFGADTAKALDYWYDNSLFSKWKKPPVPFDVDAPVMEADFLWYRSLGIEDIGCFACFLGADYEELHGRVDIAPFAKAYHQA
ncbi:MAG: DUF4838 domain-containing protein [Ruminococcaceae bacterium]|nr:DUF4838 domain-containing protein [Oscillospiraceae bacterium]